MICIGESILIHRSYSRRGARDMKVKHIIGEATADMPIFNCAVAPPHQAIEALVVIEI